MHSAYAILCYCRDRETEKEEEPTTFVRGRCVCGLDDYDLMHIEMRFTCRSPCWYLWMDDVCIFLQNILLRIRIPNYDRAINRFKESFSAFFLLQMQVFLSLTMTYQAICYNIVLIRQRSNVLVTYASSIDVCEWLLQHFSMKTDNRMHRKMKKNENEQNSYTCDDKLLTQLHTCCRLHWTWCIHNINELYICSKYVVCWS